LADSVLGEGSASSWLADSHHVTVCSCDPLFCAGKRRQSCGVSSSSCESPFPSWGLHPRDLILTKLPPEGPISIHQTLTCEPGAGRGAETRGPQAEKRTESDSVSPGRGEIEGAARRVRKRKWWWCQRGRGRVLNRCRSPWDRFVLQDHSEICYEKLIGNFLHEKLGTEGQVTCSGGHHESAAMPHMKCN
jgi:hypothetical protein